MAVWLLILSMVMSGCSRGNRAPKAPDTGAGAPNTGAGNPATGPVPARQGIARDDAEALVSAFLQDRVEGRQSAAIQRLVPAARDEAKALGEWTQFHLLQATEVDEGWLIQTREYLNVAPEPRSTVVTDFYLVVREEGGQLAIDRPERRWSAQKAEPYRRVVVEAFPDPKSPDRRLLMTRDARTVLAQVEPRLPETFRPHGASPDAVFGVGTNGWGALALSPTAQQIAFVTRGTHPLLGLVDGSGQVRGLNLWFEGGAGELAWSRDSQYLAATNMSPRGVFVLQLWSLSQNAPVEVKGLPDGRDVSRLQWQGDTLHLRAGAERWVVNPVTGQAIPAPATR